MSINIRRKTLNLQPNIEEALRELQHETDEKVAVVTAQLPAVDTALTITVDGTVITTDVVRVSAVGVNEVFLPAAVFGIDDVTILNFKAGALSVTVSDSGTETIRLAATLGSTVTTNTHAAGTAKVYRCYETGKWVVL